MPSYLEKLVPAIMKLDHRSLAQFLAVLPRLSDAYSRASHLLNFELRFVYMLAKVCLEKCQPGL
jgi:hypothetical protein